VTARALVAAGIITLLMPSVVMSAPPKRGKPPAPPKSSAAVEHEVRKGETLSAIAKKYRVTVSSLV